MLSPARAAWGWELSLAPCKTSEHGWRETAQSPHARHPDVDKEVRHPNGSGTSLVRQLEMVPG